jgi:DNA polymerase III epsilon subunit-like protein
VIQIQNGHAIGGVSGKTPLLAGHWERGAALPCLYIDTASSGLWRFPQGGQVTPDDEQPKLVRLSWLLDDADGHTIAMATHLVRLPPDERMDQKVAHVSGIYDHHLITHGISLDEVLREFVFALRQTDLVVAHFWQLHRHTLERSMRQVFMPTIAWPDAVCAMTRATPIVRIPSGRQSPQYKSPSFKECCGQFGLPDPMPSMDPKNDGISRVKAVRIFWHHIQQAVL